MPPEYKCGSLINRTDLVRLLDNHFMRTVDGMDFGIVIRIETYFKYNDEIYDYPRPNIVILWHTGELFHVSCDHIVLIATLADN